MTLCGRPPKLTPAQVDEARRLRARGETWVDIARFFGVAQSTLARHLAGGVKNHRRAADSASGVQK